MDINFKLFFSFAKMAIATFCSRILGIVRELIIAALFGAQGGTDYYFVALKIPNIFRELFGENSFSSAFVPTFTEVKMRDEKLSRQLFACASLFLLTISVIACISMILFAAPIISLIAPTYVDHPQQFALTTQMLKILAPFLIFITLSALSMGVLNTLKYFFIPSFSAAFSNIIIITLLLILPHYLQAAQGRSIVLLAVVTLMGAIGQFFFQIPFLIKENFYPIFHNMQAAFTYTALVIKRLLVSLVALAANQINSFINTIIASGLVSGSVSWLNFSFRLFYFPLGIIGVSLGNSNLIHFSEEWKKGNRERAIDLLQSTYKMMLFFMVFVTALFIPLSLHIVTFIYLRGAFHLTDAYMTSLDFQLYMLGLPAYALYRLLVPVFYTIDRPQIPLLTSFISVLINLSISLLFAHQYGQHILALAISISMSVNTFILLIFLQRKLKFSYQFFIDSYFAKLLFAGMIIFFLNFYLKEFFPIDLNSLHRFINLIILGTTSLITYLLTLYLLGALKKI